MKKRKDIGVWEMILIFLAFVVIFLYIYTDGKTSKKKPGRFMKMKISFVAKEASKRFTLQPA